MAPERDLFANFERMRREMDELFGDVFERTGLARRRAGFSPPIDVYYTDDPPRVVVRAELAGIDPDELALEIEGRELTISGHRRPENAEGRAYQQLEIEHGPFQREDRARGGRSGRGCEGGLRGRLPAGRAPARAGRQAAAQRADRGAEGARGIVGHR